MKKAKESCIIWTDPLIADFVVLIIGVILTICILVISISWMVLKVFMRDTCVQFDTILPILIVIICSSAFLRFSIKVLPIYFSRYIISDFGITIHTPLLGVKEYRWDEFSDADTAIVRVNKQNIKIIRIWSKNACKERFNKTNSLDKYFLSSKSCLILSFLPKRINAIEKYIPIKDLFLE